MTDLIHRTATMDKAVFVVSLDTELGWGSFDKGGLRRNSEYYIQERDIVRRLLALFDTHKINATWAIVGHLFLESCSESGPDNHNHVLQPAYSWYPDGWLSHDPFSNLNQDPLFYAPDIVDNILGSRQAHEIASHTFTHAILGDPECSREVAHSQLSECQRLAKAVGTEMVSMVFPRNSIGHLDVLSELGFCSFRGQEARWYRSLALGQRTRKLCHYLDRMTAVSPRCYKELSCYRVKTQRQWLFDVPASMFYAPFGGLWNLVGLSRRVLQAKKGIGEAIRRKALFHLWFHPFNLATSPLLPEGLDEVLGFLAGQVKAGNIESLTMGETAKYMNRIVGE
ncbi:MAG: polysaccharide deacetylase family protein [Desulfomonile tiedjei]|nr:polysaccharide deacetylase family protein [Desulfomonile tiedjei]